MSRLFLWMQVCLIVAGWASVALGQFNGYEALSDWESLSRYKSGVVAGMASSYDRAGENADFNNYESPTGFQVTDLPTVTVTTIDGPGVITRFWMPHASANSAFKIQMYFDGEELPSIDTDSNQFLDGNYGYFQNPLVSTLIGGQVSYEPIVFSQSLRIESNNFALGSSTKRNYYQYSYHKLPPATQVVPYSGTLTSQQLTARDAAVQMIDNVGQNPAGSSGTSTVVATGTTNIPSGQTLILGDLSGGGMIRRLNVKMLAGAVDADMDGLRLRVRYDGQTENAVDVPVSHFFGAGHERASYKSLPLGTDSPEGFYSYWPMPFHKSAVVELYNDTASAISIDSAAIEYEPGQIPSDSLYFQAVHNEELTSPEQEYHMMLQAQGVGQYVGNLLYIRRNGTSTSILEGDEIITVDELLSHHGTGLEDAYNGGFFYNHVLVQTEPDSEIGPYHGLLRMNDQVSGDNFIRTDQYRWMIGDYVPFDENIVLKIENYGKGANVLFGSTVFYYLRPYLPGDVNGDGWIDEDDLSIVISYWGQSGVGREYGDLNGNGVVDGPDYSEVLSYWGTGVGLEPPQDAVPEPATLGLMLAVGAMFLLRPKGTRPLTCFRLSCGLLP